jgi:2'-5' RNA ligase
MAQPSLLQSSSFLGLKDDWRPRDLLFLAIRPPAGIGSRIVELAGRLGVELGIAGRPLLRRRLHIALWSFPIQDGVPDASIRAIVKVADTLVAEPFDVTFDHAESFPGKASSLPFVLSAGEGVSALIEFQRKVHLALARAGLAPNAPVEFVPHITLLHDRAFVPRIAVPPVTWTVKDFVLIHIMVGSTRPIELERWSLGDSIEAGGRDVAQRSTNRIVAFRPARSSTNN